MMGLERAVTLRSGDKNSRWEFLARSVRLTTRFVLVSDREGENVFSHLREQTPTKRKSTQKGGSHKEVIIHFVGTGALDGP